MRLYPGGKLTKAVYFPFNYLMRVQSREYFIYVLRGALGVVSCAVEPFSSHF